MQYLPEALGADMLGFLSERHLGTLTLVVSAAKVHVTPVGFSWDDQRQIARVITFAAAHKVRLLRAGSPLTAALSQVDGGRWCTLYGTATVTSADDVCADAVARYAVRYRQPRDRGADRRTIELSVSRVVGSI